MSDTFVESYSFMYPKQYKMIDLQIYKEMLYQDKDKIRKEHVNIKKKLNEIVDDYVINIINIEYDRRLKLMNWLIDDVQYKIKLLKEK